MYIMFILVVDFIFPAILALLLGSMISGLAGSSVIVTSGLSTCILSLG
jgi:hypothetical protein